MRKFRFVAHSSQLLTSDFFLIAQLKYITILLLRESLARQQKLTEIGLCKGWLPAVSHQ